MSLIDPSYFRDLAGADAADICRRTGCRYDDEANIYTFSVWGEDYAVFPSESRVEKQGANPSGVDRLMGLFIVYYLLNGKDLEVANEWISEKDMPGGTTFFRGPHVIPTELISDKYDHDVQGFVARCHQLGGTPLAMADGAFAFTITQRVPVAVLLWDGDEDFPAEAKVLFDRSITEHLTLDIIFSLADVVCRRIAGSVQR